MHSRYGLKTEYLGKDWFNCISACIEKARKLNIKAYLYDEDRWPSGSAGGNITRTDKKFRTRILCVKNTADINKTEQLDLEKKLGMYVLSFDEEKKLISYKLIEEDTEKENTGIYVFNQCAVLPRPWENDGTYIDTLNEEAVSEFIKVTHHEYATRYSQDFGNLIPAIFTDEPNYGYWFLGKYNNEIRLPWTDSLPEEFQKRRGYNILEHLPELVFQKAGEQYNKVRGDYYRTVTELFTENFSRHIGLWCEDNHLLLTGHVLLEGTLNSQITAVGACMPHYEHMQWPGVDILCDQTEELATLKQCTSVAAQLGKERVLSELYGCTGWDWPMEGHKFQADWQMVNGINFFCPHLSHYSLLGGAKRDYPASIIDHSPWWKYYKNINDYISRTSFMLTQGMPVRNILIIHPIESAWGMFSYENTALNDPVNMLNDSLNSIIYGLSKEHYDWDFADEFLLAKYGKPKKNELVLGEMKYKLVIVPPLATLRSSTVNTLQKFAKNGGHIIFVDSEPKLIDGKPNKKIEELKHVSKKSDANQFICEIEKKIDRQVSITEKGEKLNYIWSLVKRISNGYIVFIQSHDRKKSHDITVSLKDACNPVILWDSLKCKRYQLDADIQDKNLNFSLELPASCSALLTCGLDIENVEESVEKPTFDKYQELEGPFESELTEPNSMPLDYCRYKVKDEDLSELLPTLKVDQILRSRFGLVARNGTEQQPWYLASKSSIDRRPFGKLQLLYSFNITQIPKKCKLVIEKPEDYKITLNDNIVNLVDGCWVDEDFKTIDIAHTLTKGTNNITLDLMYNADSELEDLYLIGDFGVSKLDNKRPRTPDNITIVSAPSKLNVGSWVGQGLDFYTGGVRYKFTLPKAGDSKKITLKLKEVKCTIAAVIVNNKAIVLPWPPFEEDITEYLTEEQNQIEIEVIGGRRNTLGPLHTPKQPWTGPEEFSPDNPKWTSEYQLGDHGLMKPVMICICYI